MQLKSYAILGMLAVGVSTGCTSGRNVALKPDSFVGDYIYRSADKGEQHDQDRLTLKADGKYFLVHMPGGHRGSTEEGGWRLENGPTPNILLGNAGYPAEIQGKDVRLLINADLGHWYEKTE